MEKCFTTNPVQAGDFNEAMREFGRTPDVERCFGIKKGTLYNLFDQGKIRGVTLRPSGHIKGVRLWDMASIRNYIHSQMDESAPTPAQAD
ncbi:MAG: hypothetical protein ACKJSK_17080 [Roseibacillus sp.]